MTTTLILVLLGVVLLVYAGQALRAYLRMRGRRIVVCPETNRPVAVTVDAGRAAISAVWERPEIKLDSCSRWPERAGCNQACTGQISVAPEDTLVSHVLQAWYSGKDCAICRRPIPPVTGGEPRPGLLDVGRHRVLGCDEIPPEQIPDVLAAHLPVCAACYIAESFREHFPDLVTDRAATPQRDLVVH
ncbi:MAG TPA: hypothetical protein VD833_23850 [Vicinamibacterales bacterium]|nr:hypothetical protein [Vicinamibacterales bacterium]